MRTTQPEGASPTALREFHSQQPQWSPSTSDDRLELASIEVPLDYGDPRGERLTIAISRLKATDPRRRRGILLSGNGGPGGDSGFGRTLPLELARTPLHEVYDLIGFDPRGTGDSTPLHAEVHTPKAAFDSRPPDSAFATIAEDMRERELGCRRGGGSMRPHISTRNTARDMDVIRAVLGEEKISFVGYAYGTYVGAVYGTMFPEHLDRSVLDSCVNPEWSWRQQFLTQGQAVRENVDKWAEWTGERHGHFGLGTSAEQVLATVEEVAAVLGAQPESVWLRTLFDGSVGNNASNRGRWAELATLVGALREGGLPKATELLAGTNTWRPGDTEGELRTGVLEAITLEMEWPDDLEVYYRDMREFRERYPYGYGVLRAQPWVGAFRTFQPAEEPTRVERAGYPVGLIVQADGDPMDHYAGGPAMAERLGHHLITITDSGDHEVYALGGNPEVDAHVNRYLVDGVLPAERVDVPGTTPRPDIPADRGTAAV